MSYVGVPKHTRCPRGVYSLGEQLVLETGNSQCHIREYSGRRCHGRRAMAETPGLSVVSLGSSTEPSISLMIDLSIVKTLEFNKICHWSLVGLHSGGPVLDSPALRCAGV